jgi:hypothetical protein
MADIANHSSVGPSVWERDLYDHLAGHVEAERALLEAYSTAVEESTSKALRYLVNLLLEDEGRHNRIITELAGSLRTESLGGRDSVVPNLDFDGANHDAVIDLTNQLLQREQEDAKELKRLQHELRDVKDTSLWSLLVDLMVQDTRKHVSILRFAKKHAGRPGR